MLSSARYRVTLEAPQTIFQWQDAAVVVRVQNRQGLPIDGMLVVFQVDPPRAKYASIRPARARTEGGRVRAIVRSDLVGQVQITVRVGVLTKRATITVVVPIATENGHADACRSRLEATRAVPSWIYYTYPQWANHPLASCAVIISKASVMA